MNELAAKGGIGDILAMQVNGRQQLYQGDRLRRLADVLREDLRLTGTKIGCNAGDCGA